MKKFFITLTVLFAAALGANAQFSIGAGYLNLYRAREVDTENNF